MDDRATLPSSPTRLGPEAPVWRSRPGASERIDVRVYLLTHVLLVSAALAVAAHSVQQGDGDAAIARLFFDPASNTFPLEDSFWLEILGHQAARALPVIVGAFALAAGLAGWFVNALRPWRAILLTLGAAVILGPVVIGLLKAATTSHCPHDMQMFGGVIDDAIERTGPFWASSSAAAGHCLPSGHAGGGFALVALFFAGWAAGRPAWRRRGLAIGIGIGLLFSAVRIVQGAHFPSQTLWAAAVDWFVAALLFLPLLTTWPIPAPTGRLREGWLAAWWEGANGVRWWSLGAVAFVWLAWTAGFRPLTLPDEGRYAGIAWEMLRSGDWMLPTEDGLPFFHKPPLFYWITSASMQLFGANAWAARMAPLLASTFGALAMVALLRRWVGVAQARWVFVILLAMPAFLIGAQYVNLDMLVAACIAGSVVAGAHAALCLRNALPHRRALMLAYALAALGVLAKGLIGLVLPGLVLVVWLLAIGEARLIGRMLAPVGLAMFLLVSAPWFLWMEREHAGFLHYFFVYHHFTRFTSSGFNNEHGWWFFVVAFPVLTLPWSLWLLRAPWRARPGEPADATAVRRLMWVWLLTVLVFFSIPRSKPLGYGLPMLFPIGALAADAVVAWLRDGSARRIRWPLGLAAGGALLAVGVVIVSALTYTRDNTVLARQLGQWRQPDEPVVFLREYFFDVPLHARLLEPVGVVSDWKDPAIASHDDWRRELLEAEVFAPDMAQRVLVDERALKPTCGAKPTWVVTRTDGHAELAAIAGAERMAASKRSELWRVSPTACAAPAVRARTPP